MLDSLDLPELYDQGMELRELLRKRKNKVILWNAGAFVIMLFLAILINIELPTPIVAVIGYFTVLNASYYIKDPKLTEFMQNSLSLFQNRFAKQKNYEQAVLRTAHNRSTSVRLATFGLGFFISIIVFYAFDFSEVGEYYLGIVLFCFIYLFGWILMVAFNDLLEANYRKYLTQTTVTFVIMMTVFMLAAYPIYYILRTLLFTYVLANHSYAQVLATILTAVMLRYLFIYVYNIPWRLTTHYVNRADYDGALKASLWFRRLVPYHQAWTYLYAFALSVRGDDEEAIEIFQLLTELPLTSAFFVSALLLNYAATTDDDEEAISLYETSIEMFPPSYLAYSNLALHYQKHGLYPERAYTLSLQAMKLLPAEYQKKNSSEQNMVSYTISTYAVALANMQKFEEAHTQIKNAFDLLDEKSLHPRAWLHYKLGKVYQAEQKLAEAIQQLNTVLEIAPGGEASHSAQKLLLELDSPQ